MRSRVPAGGVGRWLLVVILLIPLAAAVAVVGFGISLSSLLPVALVLACPLMHVFMMRGMHGRRGDHGDHGCHSGQVTGPAGTTGVTGEGQASPPPSTR